MFLHFSLFLFCIFKVEFALLGKKKQPRCEKQLVVLGIRPVLKLLYRNRLLVSPLAHREEKSNPSLGSDCPSGVLQSFRKWKRRAINTFWLNSRPREAFTRPRCSLCRSDCVPGDFTAKRVYSSSPASLTNQFPAFLFCSCIIYRL